MEVGVMCVCVCECVYIEGGGAMFGSKRWNVLVFYLLWYWSKPWFYWKESHKVFSKFYTI